MTSINTNIGAYSAQQNLKTANNSTLSSISRLSSGNRIDKASTDVAGLSVGTILATNVSTLRKGLENAGQASTLLQIADGGLKNISQILQRQKALSVQATSGTLSSTERSYLNQEFQALSSEIDRLVANTKFNSVSLLDGSLSKQTAMNSLTRTSTTAGTAVTTAGTIITIANAVPVAGDKITIAGVSIEFVAAGTVQGSSAAAGKVNVSDTLTGTAMNVVNFLNSSTDARLANYRFLNTGGSITAEWAGGLMNGDVVIDATLVTTGTPANFTLGTTANRTIGSGTANDLDLIGRARVQALGTTTGSILISGGAVAANSAGEGIVTRTVEQNPDFYGKLGEGKMGKFQVNWVTGETVDISLKVGDITYRTAAAVDIVSTALTAVNLVGVDQYGVALGGTLTLNIAGSSILTADIDSQDDAVVIAQRLNDEMKDITFVQNRDITSFSNGATVAVAGVDVGTLTGASVNFRSDDFSNMNIEGVKVTAPGFGQTDATIEVTINGQVYRSFAGLGSKVGTNTLINLQNLSDPSKSLTIVTGGTTLAGQTTTAFDLTSQANADAVQGMLEQAFGVTDGKSKLNFQIGANVADAIGVEVRSANTSSLYAGASLDVLTTENANIASGVLDDAIAYVTSLRADVGALQSRFDYASANLETSIQNTDAARASFLDADISKEATDFASAQVKLQASISVLAQANQLPQNLLKLIG